MNQLRIDFFEKAAPYYDDVLNFLTFKRYAGFQRKAMKILAPKKGEKLLDLCSGTGKVASWLADEVGREGKVIGMDISKGMVEWAKRRHGGFNRVEFLFQDVTKPWGYQNYFDGIFASFAIHELPEKERLAVFELCYLGLKEVGRMVIADFNPKISGNSKIISIIFFKLFERENLSFFSFDQNEILKKVGFKKVRNFPVLGGLFQITLAYR